MHIEVRSWFERKNGNTYFSVRVHTPIESTLAIPFEYGYGEHCLDQALTWLESKGVIAKGKQNANGTKKLHRGEVLRAYGITTSIVDVQRKKDL